jgi:hypothetical protein
LRGIVILRQPKLTVKTVHFGAQRVEIPARMQNGEYLQIPGCALLSDVSTHTTQEA